MIREALAHFLSSFPEPAYFRKQFRPRVNTVYERAAHIL